MDLLTEIQGKSGKIDKMKLIVGLGNPGEKYQGTRHNLGFEVVEKIMDKVKGPELGWKKEGKFKSEICKINPTLILVKPQTYMNNSGQAVKLLADYFKIPPEDIVVLHDDLDLPVGKLRLRAGGSGGGHHGVESIINSLGEDKFVRLRLGIGPTSGRTILSEHNMDSFNVERFVLELFDPSERSKIKHMTKRAVEVIEALLEKGVDVAQNQYN